MKVREFVLLRTWSTSALYHMGLISSPVPSFGVAPYLDRKELYRK